MVTPVNIAAAALITQLSVGCILAVCAFVLTRDLRGHSKLPWIVLGFTLLTTGALSFSEPNSSLWKPLLGNFDVRSIPFSTTLLVIFLADILTVFWLGKLTGGSYSPFAPVFFILPALAIFLREGFGHVVLYVVLIAVFFTFGMWQNTAWVYSESRDSGSLRERFAYWFVSVASFALATVIGYITRPR